MKQRLGVRAKTAKPRRLKRAAPKARVHKKAQRKDALLNLDAHTSIDALGHELRTALERQSATAEVLRVVSASHGDLKPVFHAILEKATRLCEAKFGTLFLYDGNFFHFAADVGAPREYVEFQKRRGPFQTTPGSQLDKVRRTKRVAHTADYSTEAVIGRSGRLGRARSSLCVPMLKDGAVAGVILIYRHEVRPFDDRQIALLESFASQVVIAIENTRLVNELHRRTEDLTEALEQQTASAEILASISGSMTDTKPVFDAIVRNLLRLFGTRFATVQVLRDALIYMPAVDGQAGFQKLIEYYPRPLDDTTAGGLSMLTKSVIQFSPVQNNSDVPAKTQQFAHEFGFDSVIFAPMIRDDRVIGAIGVAHHEPRTFSDKHVALIKAFADQAVIAIENTRLFRELRERTDDLSESLAQQTATSDVLQVISSSPGELKPVFDALLANATTICGAKFGNLFLYEDSAFRAVAMHNAPSAYANARSGRPVHPGPGTALGRVALTKQVAQIEDLKAEPGYAAREPFIVAGVELGGIRTMLAVPLLKENKLIGSINIYRQEVRPFTEKQIEFVTNFAAQVVIAIENTRLLNELRQSLQQQTATADVLKVISRSAFVRNPHRVGRPIVRSGDGDDYTTGGSRLLLRDDLRIPEGHQRLPQEHPARTRAWKRHWTHSA